SRFKGGQLAQHCLAPAPGRQLISLIISDVLGDPLDVIASGPTAPDPTTFADARQILQAKKLWDRAPASARDYLEAGLSGKHPETPKQAVAEEPRLVHRLAASIQQAVHAAANEAEALGYQVIEYVDQRDHDTLTLASYFADQVLSLEQERPVCLVSGGETTVQLPADAGRGGRNQSFALGFLLHLDALLQPADAPNDPSSNDLSWNRRSAWRGITGLFAGTDGEDGPTDTAGAFADAAVLERARELGLHPAAALARHDAYPFFDATGALFRTGLTDTNVMDLRVILLP
ncbi:MAG TPA: MOFRL family protein, partial [Gemmatales bacterium]|nr:MOFRL family protein [Gemmatales bacterium]